MAHYNPHEPNIIGQEWVPIYSGANQPVTTEEKGTTFRLDTATTVVSGGVYPLVADEFFYNPVYGVNVYPRGLEAATGPIQQVVYPVDGGVLSGDAALAGGCGSVQSALQANTTCYVDMPIADPTSDIATVDVNFDLVGQAELIDKRILKVEVLYWAFVADPPEDIPAASPGTISLQASAVTYAYDRIEGRVLGNSDMAIANLGEVNPDFPRGIDTPFAFPWISTELERFSSAFLPSGSRIYVRFNTLERSVQLYYALLRVTFCEERRVALGGKQVLDPGPGTKMIPLRAASLVTGGVPLAAGEYTVTMNIMDQGGTVATPVPPTAYARQLYEIPDHQGINLKRAFATGEMFTSEVTNDMQQISLHSTSAALTGVHGYGAQLRAIVCSGEIAAQDVRQPIIAGGTPINMTQVRFYARKSPNTSRSLLLAPSGVFTPGAVISPGEFDLLPEIWDGWKEVTLRLATAIPFQVTGGWQVWSWTSTGQDPGDPWEVLFADANSARPYNNAQLAPQSIVGTTYGGNQQRGWHDFWDDWTDATIIFSADVPAVSGLAISELTQPLVGVDPECPGVVSSCVPSGLDYHRLTWQASGMRDYFNRTLVNSWGTMDSGQTWNILTGPAADFDVTSPDGTIALPTVSTAHMVVGTARMTDVDVTTAFQTNQIAVGASIHNSVIFRVVDTSNYYEARFGFNTNATIQVGIYKVVAGTATGIAGSTDIVISGLTHVINEPYSVRVQAQGPIVRLKIWRPSIASEPTLWTHTVVDNVSPPSGTTGLRARTATSNTNSGLVVTIPDFTAENGDSGGYELQRQDNVDTDWETIMRSQSSLTSVFVDYEPRVGIQSRYRIRQANVLDFWSDWSATVSNTMLAPGVTVPSDGNSTLIFTTNFGQDGSYNLAAVMTFTGDVEESFNFVESNEVSFSRLYGRNFQLASHPTERGGEQFTRNILVQQSAIPLPSLGNFRSLRDMAWLAAPYICVRDELGNRWFANVTVPDGVVMRNRRLYVASLTITEVTDTPAIIDPEA